MLPGEFKTWSVSVQHNFYFSRSVFLDFIHRLVSNKPKIIRPRIKNPWGRKQNRFPKRRVSFYCHLCVLGVLRLYLILLFWCSVGLGFYFYVWFCNLRACVCSGLLFYGWFLVFLGFLVLGLIIFGLLDTRRWIKSKNTLRIMLIHHRQKPTEVIIPTSHEVQAELFQIC
jgi:hypothetical protein